MFHLGFYTSCMVIMGSLFSIQLTHVGWSVPCLSIITWPLSWGIIPGASTPPHWGIGTHYTCSTLCHQSVTRRARYCHVGVSSHHHHHCHDSYVVSARPHPGFQLMLPPVAHGLSSAPYCRTTWLLPCCSPIALPPVLAVLHTWDGDTVSSLSLTSPSFSLSFLHSILLSHL